MKAIVKARPEFGVELREVAEPVLGPRDVLIAVEAASVCGTDLHIYQWDAWSASRIQPPRVIGHEFCGRIIAVGSDVTERAVGDYVASESHVVDADSPWMRAGLGHVDPDTRILGVDIDGGFAPRVAIPWENARRTPDNVPPEIACFQDALGNAVHTAMAGPVAGQRVLIIGLGPIGLFAIAICRALGAAEVIGVEPSPFRIALAEQLGIDRVLRPEETAGIGPVDATLEMSGHPASLALAIDKTRPGGRISCLGVYRDAAQSVAMNDVIFKGLQLQGIVGRRLWETWDQMGELLGSGRLQLAPIVTHRMPYTEFESAMELLSAGRAGKVVFDFANAA
ncbi:MAG: alcohol dehydrogenase catalytic domain-containing protein [Fimbriimonadaceae bacterium]|nr:alcohol dehydrogenase catalytic domain-containing protein [Fimbriimonadaceae bacterium]